MLLQTQTTPARRAGFTLVEIMVVVVIIGILAAILVPVLGGIIRRTNEAAVKVEINSLENAVSDFKAKFGCNPPDYIFLYEFSNPNANTGWAGDAVSRGKITRIWPRFNFGSTVATRDLNNDGDTTDAFFLSGAECLVFFLGGMPKGDGNGGIFMTGFSKNPSDPFRLPASNNIDESRDGPFFEFPSSRLRDVEVSPAAPDGFPEFIDSLSNQVAPYLYLSSNSGSGYDATGRAGSVFHNSIGNTANPLYWNRHLPYRQSPTGPRWNAKSFQIISPGYGPHENAAGQFCPYGISEVYDPENSNVLLPLDADNITNFSAGGRLQP